MPPASLDKLLAFFMSPAGRSTRVEYLLGLGFICFLNGAIINMVLAASSGTIALSTLFLVTLPFLPSQFIITIRRCHDIGLPGFYVLLFLVPMAGVLLLLVLAVLPGSRNANKYGAPVHHHPQ
jgi:uncharacterized membrane protein YhaH (DUF805 family)